MAASSSTIPISETNELKLSLTDLPKRLNIIFASGFIDENGYNYGEALRKAGLDPKEAIYLFPGRISWHHEEKDRICLPYKPHMGGGGLAQAVSAMGKAHYPSLSLPTVEATEKDAEQAICDLWRLAGRATVEPLAVALPVRPALPTFPNLPPLTASDSKVEELTYQGSFGGGIAAHSEIATQCAHYYLEQFNILIKLVNSVSSREEMESRLASQPKFLKAFQEGIRGEPQEWFQKQFLSPAIPLSPPEKSKGEINLLHCSAVLAPEEKLTFPAFTVRPSVSTPTLSSPSSPAKSAVKTPRTPATTQKKSSWFSFSSSSSENDAPPPPHAYRGHVVAAQPNAIPATPSIERMQKEDKAPALSTEIKEITNDLVQRKAQSLSSSDSLRKLTDMQHWLKSLVDQKNQFKVKKVGIFSKKETQEPSNSTDTINKMLRTTSLKDLVDKLFIGYQDANQPALMHQFYENVLLAFVMDGSLARVSTPAQIEQLQQQNNTRGPHVSMRF